ncbi:MAG: T9SS type A sorting domain-containing protein [Bacteroidales bacterium]|nr:T9SS type A sorting domain-containing protein [Bacteroidales bacterium]
MNLFTNFAKQARFALLAALLFSFAALNAQMYQFDDSWGNAGLTLKSESAAGVRVNFSVNSIEFVDQEIDGISMKEILMPQVLLPNDEGMPNLPGFGRNIAIPQGSTARINVKSYRTETIKNIDIAPAPRIPLDTEDGPLQYRKHERVYNENAYYPAEPFILSEITQIRGVDVVTLGVTPFQYNPVTKELVIYRDVDIEVVFEGGNGQFGEDRLRSRWFDPILEDAIFNYNSLPVIDYSARVQHQNNSDATGFEYLIVVPNNPIWMPYAEQIKEWRTKQGILTGIKTLSEIGGSTVAILESYFNNAYNNWDIPPVAVLLMADYGTDANNSIISPIWDGYCASDNIFSDVDGNSMPDMIFARMTAQNATHLQTMVSKMLNYEDNPPTDPAFYNSPITALGWQTERWFQICSEVVGGFWRLQGKQPVRINAIYSGTPGTVWSTATNTATVVSYFGPNGRGYIPSSPAELGGWSGGTAQQVVNSINAGSFALQHRDHGFEQGWGEPDFQSSHINSLTNNQNNELVYVFSINCLTGKYNMSGECFTEKFHRYTYNGLNAGALGLIAASEVSYSFVNDAFVWGMFDNMYPQFMPDYGSPVQERDFLPAFGQAAGKYFLQQSQWPYNTNNKEVTYNLFHQHGGAFMQVYTEVPQNMAVTHNPILYSGNSSFTVIAPVDAYIALTVNGEIIGVAQSAGGANNIVIEPQLPPNTMVVTVTKQNYYRYEANVDIIPPTGPYVVGDSYVIHDPSGNNNGLMDYGESITLDMTLKNVGVAQATNVSTTMTSADEYVTITDNYAFVGTVAPNATVTVNNAFALTVSANIPDNHSVSFTLTSTNGTDTWISYISITGHAPHLKFKEYVVNDGGNGILDPGETAPLVITVENTGSAAAYNVIGSLTSTDPYVSVLTSQPQNMGNLNAGTTANCTFTVSASGNVPAGYTANLDLSMNADLGVTQQDVISLLFPDYCYPTANCSFADGFTGFALEQINNMNSGCSASGYGNFTSMVANLAGGQTYTVQWKTGYSNQQACLWIDLNDNKEFEATERLITNYVMAQANVVYTTTFTVPAGNYYGDKRIRIRANWQNSSSDPCANFSYGETEDYTANFGNPVNLEPPQNVSCNVTGNNVTITWQAPAGTSEDVLGYNVYRDGQKIANMITVLTYTNTNVPVGSYWYSVTAVYQQGESGLANPMQVNIGSLTGKLQGFVRDAVTNLVIPNAWVSALNTDYGAVTYNTPFGSHYTLNLPGGTYTIVCSAPGYQSITVNNVVILDGQTRAINFYMYSGDSPEVTDLISGIQLYSMDDVTIYPNPATDEVNISTSSMLRNVKIINNMGQLIFNSQINDYTLKINTSDFNKGFYFIEVETESSKFIEKLIVR